MTDTEQKPKTDYVKILKSLSAEQWIYVICAVIVVGYGLNVWISGMTKRNTTHQMPQLVSNVGQDSSVSENEVKQEKFSRIYKNLPLPDGSKLSEADRNKLLREIKQNPVHNNENYAFTVSVPSNWKRSDNAGAVGGLVAGMEEISFPILTTVEKYYGPAEIDMIPVFKVDFEDIKYQISAETLMNDYLLKRSITPLGIKVSSENRAEAMYMDVIEQSTFVCRSLYMINGKTSVVMTIAVPVDIYEKHADIMGAVSSSFKFDKEPVIAAEETENFSLMGVLAIDYFKSWDLTNVNDESSMNLSFQLYNRAIDGNTLNGLIEVKALRINKNVLVEDVLKQYMDVMKKRNIVIKKLIKNEKIEGLQHDYNYAVLEVYDADLVTETDKKLQGIIAEDKKAVTPQFFQLATLNNGNYIAFISLLGPTEQNDILEYGRNIMQFKNIVESLKIRERKY